MGTFEKFFLSKFENHQKITTLAILCIVCSVCSSRRSRLSETEMSLSWTQKDRVAAVASMIQNTHIECAATQSQTFCANNCKCRSFMENLLTSCYACSMPCHACFMTIHVCTLNWLCEVIIKKIKYSTRKGSHFVVDAIGHVNEYPTMHCFGNPRHIESIITFTILMEYFWKFL